MFKKILFVGLINVLLFVGCDSGNSSNDTSSGSSVGCANLKQVHAVMPIKLATTTSCVLQVKVATKIVATVVHVSSRSKTQQFV